MDKVKNIIAGEMFPQKVGMVVGSILGLVLGLIVSDRADQFEKQSYLKEEADNGQESD